MSELPYEVVPIDSIDPASYNPRKMNPANMQKLKRSLLEFGWAVPITVNVRSKAEGWPDDEEGHKVIVGGHQRVRAATDLGWNEVPVLWVSFDEAKEKAANVALNNTEIAGEWDGRLLAKVLKELEELDASMLAATGFNDQQIRQLLKALDDKPETPQFPLTPRMLENYDYIMVICENEIDWTNLQTIMHLEKRQSYKKDSKAGLGMCRVLTYDDFMKRWEAR